MDARQSFPQFSPLKFKVRADLFNQLAAMDGAGLSVDAALRLAGLPPSLQPRLVQMRKSIALGFGIAEAGARSGVFTALETSLLTVAFNCGTAERTYRRLADFYARKAVRSAAMKSRLMLPLAMLLVAILVQPLPRLIAGSLSGSAYLLQCALKLSALGAAASMFVEWPYLRWITAVSRSASLDRVLPQLPLLGPIYLRRNIRDFFESLALLIEAGMPILQALPMAVASIHHPETRQMFSRIKPRIEGGAAFAEALGELHFVGRETACALALTGETSGDLPEMLLRYADAETADINRFDDQVAEWTPRLVYLLSALMVGNGILRSGAFMPALPADAR